MITKRQADVYKLLTDMILKAIIALVLLFCFCIVLFYLITSEPTWQKTAPLGIIDGMMAATFYKLIGHFFPDRNNS
jgi:hypothetical protein